MIILGIESTAHTFGIAILDEKGKVYCNVKDTYTTEKGGIIPVEAAKHHERVKYEMLEEALKVSGLELKDIDLISFSQGPGLSPCLLKGKDFAKELAKKIEKPLVGVNHCIAHLEIGRLMTKAKDPVLLYCSGANTQIIAYAAGKYRIFGETLDVGIGNFIDTFARHTGLGFPGGPKIAELAKTGKNYIELPYSIKGMDVAFSGMLTNLQQKYNKDSSLLPDLAFSLQETAFAMLIEAAERAMAHLKKKELLLGGGVACNKRLQEMCKIMCKERKAKEFCPEPQFLVDNAAMIAWQGFLQKKDAIKPHTEEFSKIDIKPYQRTDDVEVTWR
jgi:N6-L-threonylcarbamoyladenine synthase